MCSGALGSPDLPQSYSITSLANHMTTILISTLFYEQPIGEATPPEAQFVFTTATLPEIVTEQITMEFPDVSCRMGPGLHRISPNVEEVLVDCSGPANQERSPETAFENKRLALLRALEQDPSTERTLIFCNTIDQCRRVENALERTDRYVIVLSCLVLSCLVLSED